MSSAQFVRACAAVLAMAVAIAGVAVPGMRARADHVPDQVPGYDISWPQCPNRVFPNTRVAFTVIGINGGRPFTPNPCFVEQYRWAQRFERNPAVYVNVDYPKAGRDLPAATGPYGTCAPADEWCRAYNYGYAIGREVVTRAQSLGITPSWWWLDVETGNYWSDDPTYNGQVVRATLDFFKERRLPVGLYSTPRQWRIIAGTYVPGVPVWTAGAQGMEDARRRCSDPSYAFAGGTVKLSQFYDHGLDTNFACPSGHLVAQYPFPDPYNRTGPHNRSLSLAGSVLPHWQPVPMLSSE